MVLMLDPEKYLNKKQQVVLAQELQAAMQAREDSFDDTNLSYTKTIEECSQGNESVRMSLILCECNDFIAGKLK